MRIITLSLPLLAALLFGCIKEPEVDLTALGPQATEDDMERVVSKALYGIDPWKSAVGQQVIYDFNARIENSETVQPLLRQTITTRSREQLQNPPRLRIINESHEVDLRDGAIERSEMPPQEFEGSGPGEPASVTVLRKMTDGALRLKSGLGSKEERPVKKVTYHNLKESSGEMAPPQTVATKPDCGGVPACKLRYFKLEYDEVRWFTDTEYDVQHWMFLISRDAPFVTYILERCLAGFVNYESRNIYIRQCQFARDFSYSGATAP
jgi:hypothetical protein